MRKHKLSRILNALFSFHNHFPTRKKGHSDKESFLIGLRKIARRRFNIVDPNLNEKNVVNYITSRHMRKTITPGLIERDASKQSDKLKPVNLNKTVNLVGFNWKQSEQPPLYSMNSLKLHTNSNLLGSLITKEPAGTEEQHQEEDSWGGPEAYKLITFLRDDFDDVTSKIPALIVFFYAFWCPHCLRLKKPFGNAAILAREQHSPVVFAAFDVTINPEIADKKGVVGIPMIKYYVFGKYVSTYTGRRTTEDILKFVKNPPNPKSEKPPDV